LTFLHYYESELSVVASSTDNYELLYIYTAIVVVVIKFVNEFALVTKRMIVID
jgi:hypothetical protein